MAGYGFGASVLEASVVYLLPGGIARDRGVSRRRAGGRPVRRPAHRCSPPASGASAGSSSLAFLRSAPWAVVLAGLLTQLAITLAFAALPALVVQAVRRSETGVANAVNSIARSVGQALGSTLTVTLLAAAIDPATGFPRDVAFTQVSAIGAGACIVVVLMALLGRRGEPERPDAAEALRSVARD